MTRSGARTLTGAILLALGGLTGCAGTGPAASLTPSAAVTTAIQGWEHYFQLEWAAQPRPQGQALAGYVYNKYGASAVGVQLLAQGLDAGGNLVGQKLVWVHGGVPPLERAFFTVPGMPPAERYRVTVWAFEFMQSGNSNFP